MFQITTDLDTLSQAQREAFASFIVSFPTSEVAATTEQEVTDNTVIIPAFPISEDLTPEEAFGPHPPATLDKKGLPWDERIHASSKALVADGTWRQKRGVDPALVARKRTKFPSGGWARLE